MELPAEFLRRMQSLLKEEYPAFLASYSKPACKGIRVNTLKIDAQEFKKISPFALEEVCWEKDGFYAQGESLGKTVLHSAGLYYVQEPSAMSAAPALNVNGGERVLDLCSAPGGKGTQLAQKMKGEGLIVLNEISFRRAKILSSNVERMGITNAVVTCSSPDKLKQIFSEYFDKILVDAPCSGEGMFKKEENAAREWSESNVLSCAERQKYVLNDAYTMLAGGGTLVYSTCTFAPEEDELQIDAFLKSHPDCRLVKQEKLYPHRVRGEGHFYAVIVKESGDRCDIPTIAPTVKDKRLLSIYRQWEKETLRISFDNLHLIGSVLYSLPNDMPDIPVQTLRAGIRLGEFSGNVFKPSHSLAMCLKSAQARCIDVDEKTALSYLHGLTFDCDSGINGWRVVTYLNYPLGWCKCSSSLAKNHLPAGVRI